MCLLQFPQPSATSSPLDEIYQRSTTKKSLLSTENVVKNELIWKSLS